MKRIYLFVVLCSFLLNVACANNPRQVLSNQEELPPPPQVGAAAMEEYLPLLQNKKLGLVAHHASRVGETHLLDTLLSRGLQVKRVFAPEHGFRGNAEGGAYIADEKDTKTGTPIISIYGVNKKPKAEHLRGLDFMLFDLQDVGVRCYTYLSTLHYVMEACAENNIPLVIFDRPNPNGHFVDGPLLNIAHRSFVGVHPIPMVHGMTLGELAQMINGEKWLANGVQCKLHIIACQNYDHTTPYLLPIAPSPNLPNQRSVYLYPSLCFFEGTTMSVGRGTDFPFQAFGHPAWSTQSFEFKPRSIKGVAENPPHVGKVCKGINLSTLNDSALYAQQQINLEYLLAAQRFFGKKLFVKFFVKLAGTDTLQKQIESGMSAEAIRAAWRKENAPFLQLRKKYLLYRDF